MKFFKRYNRTAKLFKRSWMRSGVSVIVLCCGLVFGSVSVASADENTQILQRILSAIQDQSRFFAGSGDLPVFLVRQIIQGNYITNALPNIVSALYENGDISDDAYLELINAALTDPSAPLFERLLAIESSLEFLSSRTNFVDYSSDFFDLQSGVHSIDSLIQDLYLRYPTLEYNVAGSANYLFGISYVLQSVLTGSGNDNIGGSAFEVNDSETHNLLSSMISALASLSDIDSSLQDINDSVDGMEFLEMLGILYDIQSDTHSIYQDFQSFLTAVVRGDETEVSVRSPGVQVYDPYSIRQFNLSSNFYSGFVQNLVSGSGTNRAVRVSINGFSSYTNAVLGSYTGQVATISTNPIPEKREGLDPEDSQEYTQSLTDSFDDVSSMLDPLRRFGSRIENISIDPHFGDNSGNSRFYIIRPENAFWNSFSFMRSRSSDSDGGIYIDFAEGDLRNFCTKCNGFLEALIHWLQPILIFLVMYHEARWTLNFFHHDRDL